MLRRHDAGATGLQHLTGETAEVREWLCIPRPFGFFNISVHSHWSAHYRILSRVGFVLFKGPPVRTETPAYSALKKLKQNAPKSIAFLIALEKDYRQRGVFDIDNLEEKLATLFPHLGDRTLNGYAHIWFTEQASFRVLVFSAHKMVYVTYCM